MRWLSAMVLCACIAALAGCGGGDGPTGSTTPAAVGTTVTSSIASAQTGISYSLDIWLPQGYATSTARYPVVYSMDCDDLHLRGAVSGAARRVFAESAH